MKNNKKQKIDKKDCSTCINLEYIGEGDHICSEFTRPVFILEDWCPTDDYFKCKGRNYQKK